MLVIIQHIYKYVHEKKKQDDEMNKKIKVEANFNYVVQECGWGLFFIF
jgi:hypothetical protein